MTSKSSKSRRGSGSHCPLFYQSAFGPALRSGHFLLLHFIGISFLFGFSPLSKTPTQSCKNISGVYDDILHINKAYRKIKHSPLNQSRQRTREREGGHTHGFDCIIKLLFHFYRRSIFCWFPVEKVEQVNIEESQYCRLNFYKYSINDGNCRKCN